LLLLSCHHVSSLQEPSSQAQNNPQSPYQRQPIPTPSVLVLPPPAPLPSSQKIKINLASKKSRSPVVYHPVPHSTPTPSPTFVQRKRIPTAFEIIKQNDQIIELDEKYYQIAVESDRYGYKNQAIKYYKKYLFVAPTGPHAEEVRSRLSQLESGF
jgi:hypothetical protein